MSLCLCGQSGRRHEITDACLTPEERDLVRRFKAEYDRADLGPWWHQAAGRDVTAPAHPDGSAQVSESARVQTPGGTP